MKKRVFFSMMTVVVGTLVLLMSCDSNKNDGKDKRVARVTETFMWNNSEYEFAWQGDKMMSMGANGSNSNVMSFAYDNDKLTRIIWNSERSDMDMVYDDGRVVEMKKYYKGSLTNTYTLSYDKEGNIEKVADSSGKYLAFQWEKGNVVSYKEVDGSGELNHRYHYEYENTPNPLYNTPFQYFLLMAVAHNKCLLSKNNVTKIMDIKDAEDIDTMVVKYEYKEGYPIKVSISSEDGGVSMDVGYIEYMDGTGKR